MPLVWDIFHASMNAKGGQLKNLNFSKELKILNFFFFLEKVRNLDLLKEFGNFY